MEQVGKLPPKDHLGLSITLGFHNATHAFVISFHFSSPVPISRLVPFSILGVSTLLLVVLGPKRAEESTHLQPEQVALICYMYSFASSKFLLGRKET